MSSLFPYRPTLLGRSLLLAISELIANAICWIVAVILFARNSATRPLLSLALLAWTLGLRHALDADHIRSKSQNHTLAAVYPDSIFKSAIDNATRGLLSLGQLPITCGLFFSLGHSTIVIVVTVAIAISSNVFEKMHQVGEVGGIVGAAVSGSFLFLVGLANTVILWRILRQRQRDKLQKTDPSSVENANAEWKPQHNQMLMMRILGPIMTFVNRPWKMYPVGVLFGFGFDTASSIALLALSAIAKRGPDGQIIPSAHIIILPLLFTAGMSLVDSIDSIMMLWSYAGFPQHGWELLEKPTRASSPKIGVMDLAEKTAADEQRCDATITEVAAPEAVLSTTDKPARDATIDFRLSTKVARDTAVKLNVMSGLSIILTLMSILVAFSISLITIMGLIGEQCSVCIAAAEAKDGGGLAGSWWRAWARANDNSGYIGVAIVGAFLTIVGIWYGTRWILGRTAAGRGNS